MNLEKYYKGGMNYPIVENSKDKIVLSILNGEKESKMTYYQILPGIDLRYNSFNSSCCPKSNYQPNSENIIEINHCKQGRYGSQINNDEQVFLGVGEIEANIHNINRKKSRISIRLL